mgnify:CR=1 FL=1
MIFRTDIKGRRTVEEYLECKECNNQMFSQVDCCTRCKGDDLKWMTQYTVYKVVYAEDEGDAVETALDMMTDFETASGKIIITNEQDSKTPVIDTGKFIGELQ